VDDTLLLVKISFIAYLTRYPLGYTQVNGQLPVKIRIDEEFMAKRKQSDFFFRKLGLLWDSFG
jgi:hypothetical protein